MKVTITLDEPQAIALCNMLNELDYNPDACHEAEAQVIEQVQAQVDFSHDAYAPDDQAHHNH